MPLVHDFVPVDQGFEGLSSRLLAGDHDDLARRLRAEDAAGVVTEGVGHARFHDETLVVPLHLAGTGAPFARLDADLRVERVDAGHTHLTLTGSYQSAASNRRALVVQQRLTESWVRAFLTRLAGSLAANGHVSR